MTLQQFDRFEDAADAGLDVIGLMRDEMRDDALQVARERGLVAQRAHASPRRRADARRRFNSSGVIVLGAGGVGCSPRASAIA